MFSEVGDKETVPVGYQCKCAWMSLHRAKSLIQCQEIEQENMILLLTAEFKACQAAVKRC